MALVETKMATTPEVWDETFYNRRMVARSENKSIVRYDRERIRGYRIGGSVLFFLAVANLTVGLDEAAGYSRWGHRILVFGQHCYRFRTINPVTHSDLPKVRKRIGMALLPSEQDRLTQCQRDRGACRCSLMWRQRAARDAGRSWLFDGRTLKA